LDRPSAKPIILPILAEKCMNVDEAVRSKRAIRRFSATPLPEDILWRILRAGRRAQSSKNTQPWQFIVLRDPERLLALSRLGQYADHLAGAPVGVVIITPDPKQRWSILFDAGQAAAYMQLAACEQGVGSCLATIYDTDEARNLLHFPSDWEAHVALSFGFPAEPEEMSRPLRPGGRKPPDELFHFEEWGRRA
jgi:nitroreductase